ncbi:MAG: hypothetical protein WD294_06065 [Phycisphaeraceae bacterium]
MTADIETIESGSQVRVEVVKKPTNAAAVKTLKRVLLKSPEHAEDQKVQKRGRVHGEVPLRRGGRIYAQHPRKTHVVKGELGESGTIRVTGDVRNDLNSVKRFITVTPA